MKKEVTNKLIESLEKLTNKKVKLVENNLIEGSSKLKYQLASKGKYLIADLIKFNELLHKLEIEDDFELGEDAIDSQSTFGAAGVLKNVTHVTGNYSSSFTLDQLIKEIGDEEFVKEELVPLYLKQGYIM